MKATVWPIWQVPLATRPLLRAMAVLPVLGGGLGCAIALPVARGLHEAGNQVDLIAGFRNEERVILQDEMKAACTDLHTCTDDGSFGYHGFVTNKLEELIKSGVKFNQIFAIGPLP